MILIPCPYCGPRAETEFRCGSEGATRPSDPSVTTDVEWTDYLYRRDNSARFQRERWWHEHGCQMWFWIRRNRTTHEIVECEHQGGAT